MSEQFMLELLGYAASVLVAISLMMSSILRLRIINLLGAVTFAVYGWLIGAVPVAAVNLFIVAINLYYLHGMLRGREYFRLLEVSPSSEYLEYFLSFHAEQIRRFLPDVSLPPRGADVSVMVLRDLVPAGIFMGAVHGETLHVTVDFVIPQFRDFKVGRYLFEEQAEFFHRRGIREIVSAPGNRAHAGYLRRMGFRPVSDAGETLYRLEIG